MGTKANLHDCTSKTALQWVAEHPDHLDLISWCPGKIATIYPALTDNPAYSPDHLDELMHPIMESSEASSCLEVHAPVPIRYLRMQIALRRPHMLSVLDAHRYLADHPEKTLDDAAEQIGRKQAMITNQTKVLRPLIDPIINVYHLAPKNDLEAMILNGMSQAEIGRELHVNQPAVSSYIKKTCCAEYRALSKLGVYSPIHTQARVDFLFAREPDPRKRLLMGVAWGAIRLAVTKKVPGSLRDPVRRLLNRLERGDVPANQSGASEALLRAYPSLHPIIYPKA